MHPECRTVGMNGLSGKVHSAGKFVAGIFVRHSPGQNETEKQRHPLHPPLLD